MFLVWARLSMMDGKFGNRFRRKDGFFLFGGDFGGFLGADEKMKKIWEFGKTMLFRKQMKKEGHLGFGW